MIDEGQFFRVEFRVMKEIDPVVTFVSQQNLSFAGEVPRHIRRADLERQFQTVMAAALDYLFDGKMPR